MNRREFITLIGGAAAWPLAARARQPGKSPTIGFLGATTPTIWSPFVGAFLQRLRELGWVDGRDIAIEYRWAEGRDDRYAAFAAEFVQRRAGRGDAPSLNHSRRVADLRPRRPCRSRSHLAGVGRRRSLARSRST